MSAEDDCRHVSLEIDGEERAAALTYWREFPAEQFDQHLKSEILSCVERIHSKDNRWRAAVAGDAAAAIKLALRMRMPKKITALLDLTMTVLLASALQNRAAAFVLANSLTRAPLDRIDQIGLATSWLMHGVWCESRARNRDLRRRFHHSRRIL
jgi:hypothetical protein